MSLFIPKYSTDDGFGVTVLKTKLRMICNANVEAIGVAGWADALPNMTVSIFDRSFNGYSLPRAAQCSALEAKLVHKDEELRKLSLEVIHALLQMKETLNSDAFVKIAHALQGLRPIIEIALRSYTISDEIHDFLLQYNIVDNSLLENLEESDDDDAEACSNSGSDTGTEEQSKSHVAVIRSN